MSSIDRKYFDQMYTASGDPWNFATSWYESRKYALTMATLPNQRYLNAFEPGCSIGVLSELLASRCDDVLSTDIVDVALDQARLRTATLGNVRVRRLAVPEEWPNDDFDLIVISELAYYFDAQTLHDVVDLVMGSTSAGAHLVAVHWCGPTNYPLTTSEVHGQFDERSELRSIAHYQEESFLLDVWEKNS